MKLTYKLQAVMSVLAAIGIFSLPISVNAQEKLKGEIKIDGSSTVYLITEAVATNFKKLNPDVSISVGISGTGGGFKKFASGETDISDASRKIKPAEIENCKKNNIDFHEFQIAWDGLAVVVNKENDWARKMTVDQLKKIWRPDSPAKKWSDIDPAWPAEPIQLYGPGPDSGTFDYFTEAVNGKEKVTRNDYTASEDDNTLVQGVSRNKYALGYFGLAYYEAHKDKLAAVAIAAKEGDPYVTPSAETVLSNTYRPLSRPLFIYVKSSSLKRPDIRAFVEFYLRRTDLISASKYVPLSALQLRAQNAALKKALAE
jgi:phosphate transport system substrate-binding protein